MTMEIKKRGRKGFGGIRIVVHLTEEILKALDLEVERRKNERLSRAELIRRAIEARYFRKKRDDVDFIKREPPKK
jgi:metal-responsive CopG/Arc/MetJ family transcriptional regulator